MTSAKPSLPQALDPAMAAIVEAMPDLTVDDESLPNIRQLFAALAAGPEPDGIDVDEHTVDDDAGIVLRVLRRDDADQGPRPCVYWIHGGGYVIGSRMMDDVRLAAWVRALDCVLASVEYRLAPEHPFPTPLDDCERGLRWVHEHAAELGVDPGRIGIAGLSAGGGLTAALAQRIRGSAELPVVFQLLDSPMLDDRQESPSSRADWLAIWSRESNRFGWASYLGQHSGSDTPPDHAVPARATDLTGLPPTLVLAGGADGFCDEDVEYASRLNRSGVPTELHVYPGAPHGFTMFPGSSLAEQADRDAIDWIRRQFDR